jgi:hypothetical protein
MTNVPLLPHDVDALLPRVRIDPAGRHAPQPCGRRQPVETLLELLGFGRVADANGV